MNRSMVRKIVEKFEIVLVPDEKNDPFCINSLPPAPFLSGEKASDIWKHLLRTPNSSFSSLHRIQESAQTTPPLSGKSSRKLIAVELDEHCWHSLRAGLIDSEVKTNLGVRAIVCDLQRDSRVSHRRETLESSSGIIEEDHWITKSKKRSRRRRRNKAIS